MSNDAISFAAGLAGMRYGRFILGTLMGITPLAVLIGWLGENAEQLKSELIWGTAACILLYGASIYYNRRRDR